MRRRSFAAACAFAALAMGCSSSKSTGSDGGGSSSGSCDQTACTSYAIGGCGLSTDAAIEAAVASCAMPGKPTPGPADDHCSTAGDDGGALAQPVTVAGCCGSDDASAGGGGPSCPYGATMYGMEGDDDDCKYHVVWTSTPICEGAPGAQVVMTAFYKTRFDDAGAALPLTGANPETEVFTTTPGDAGDPNYCDDNSRHLGPTNPHKNHLVEGPPGTYTGNVAFDEAGAWTLRFHVNEECMDLSGESPHGHAAFHVTVP